MLITIAISEIAFNLSQLNRTQDTGSCLSLTWKGHQLWKLNDILRVSLWFFDISLGLYIEIAAWKVKESIRALNSQDTSELKLATWP